MARRGGFLSGPTGVHNTQKIRKHVLKRGVTRDMNAAAGALVNTKNPNMHQHQKESDLDLVKQRIHLEQDFQVDEEEDNGTYSSRKS